MDIESATIDDIEQKLLDDEAEIGRLRASRMTLLREVDRGGTVHRVKSRLKPGRSR